MAYDQDDDDDYETTFLSILDTFYEQIFNQTLLFSCFPSECRFCHCLCSPCCVVCVIPVLAGTTFRKMWSFCQHELYFRVGSKFRVSSRLSCCMFLQLCGLILSLFQDNTKYGPNKIGTSPRERLLLVVASPSTSPSTAVKTMHNNEPSFIESVRCVNKPFLHHRLSFELNSAVDGYLLPRTFARLVDIQC